jgi:hypothetical protein
MEKREFYIGNIFKVTTFTVITGYTTGLIVVLESLY